MYIVILAGGSGTRFWPASRSRLPKQLISITGGPTMLQRTVERVLPLKPERILVVTNQLQVEETRRQLAQYQEQISIDLIAEPQARNTAPAVGLAATLIAAHDPSGVMVVLPADHYIRNEAALRSILLQAADCAACGLLMTLGIVPTSPETGYGYLEADPDNGQNGACPVRRFVEKPDRATALAYLEAGTFYWNSGMFIWRADSLLSEMANYMPELASGLAGLALGAEGWDVSAYASRIAAVYETASSQSIDYGIMEKSDRVQMLAADIGWSDVGSWSALPDVVEPDQQGNVVVNCSSYVALDSTGCIVSGNGGVVATVGVSDLIVVATSDALLVCPKQRAQDVRSVVEQLASRGLQSYL